MVEGKQLLERPEWKEGIWRVHGRVRMRSAIAAAAAAVLALAAGTVLLRWSAAAAIGVLAAVIVVAFGWTRAQHRRALGRSGATLLGATDGDRVRNIVHGIAGDLGIEPPRLLVIDSGGPNALVTGGASPALAVTRSLIDSFTRTETEAVVAHCLIRLATGRLSDAARAAAFGAIVRIVAAPVGEEDDLRTASFTRYPPALADAIEKAEPPGGPGEPLWFVGDGPFHRGSRDRSRALREL